MSVKIPGPKCVEMTSGIQTTPVLVSENSLFNEYPMNDTFFSVSL